VAEGPQIFLPQPVFQGGKNSRNFPAPAEDLGIAQRVLRFRDTRDRQFAALQPVHVLRIFFRSDKLVVAAADKVQQIAQKLPHVCGADKILEMKLADSLAQVNPQVLLIEDAKLLSDTF